MMLPALDPNVVGDELLTWQQTLEDEGQWNELLNKTSVKGQHTAFLPADLLLFHHFACYWQTPAFTPLPNPTLTLPSFASSLPPSPP